MADDLRERLSARLEALQGQAAEDPFTNPYLRFALEQSHTLGADPAALERLTTLVEALAGEAFLARAARLGVYLGDCDPARRTAELDALFEAIADRGGFDAYAKAVEAAPFGVVLTAHPTFALSHELSTLMVELATGFDIAGQPLGPDDCAARRGAAADIRQGPPPELTLDVEHAWSVEALHNAHTAMETVYARALGVARRRWPEDWTRLRPRLATLATWVGFDQDGRTDVTWQISLDKRLDLKVQALARRRRALQPLLDAAAGPLAAPLQALADQLDFAQEASERQRALLAQVREDPARLPELSRAFVSGRATALTNASGLIAKLDAALRAAQDDAVREALLVQRAGLATEGLSLARVHVRLNAGQLHNAIRRQIGLESSPTDPANRRSYFAAIDALIAKAKPLEINFGDLAEEPASARRLMMTLAQMHKFVDASTPVRFLIAETETGFTLLTALYFARLFDVEDHIEISPLFETQEALERGEKVIEEALRSRHFRTYLQRQGRLAIEFGFSDSGRFVGQLAATFRIERLRFRLAELLKAHGLSELEIVFFNTHGESVGRGGHPGGLSDRFRYAAPPRSRVEFARIGVAVKEEDAFQGGEGYLPLLSAPAALATLTAALQSVLVDDPEAEGDPIYEDPDFASEFFATMEQAFAGLVADPDYAALVGLFATQLLPKSGSRPTQRQSGDGGRPRKLASVSELRAIPNNGVLQQLGYLANSLYGLGRAAGKDLKTFQAMRERSPRFRRAAEIAVAAARASEAQVLQGYAATVDPALWVALAGAAEAPECDLGVAAVASRTELGEHMARVLRLIRTEDIRIRAAGVETRQGPRLQLLHALRLTLIQRLARLIVDIPDFNPRGDVTLAAIQERLLRLDAPSTLSQLRDIFPNRRAATAASEFGEASSYAAILAHAYERENREVFAPIEALFSLMLQISTAVTHEVGACG